MNTNNIEIVKMNLSDLDLIENNLEKDFDNFWNYTILKSELLSSSSLYFIAKLDNTIIGFVGIKLIFDEVELMNIVVKKDNRNSKVASLLLEYIIKLCKENKKSIINLEVNVKNTIAINLYKKYNFNQTGLRKKYYNGIDDAILMSLNIL